MLVCVPFFSKRVTLLVPCSHAYTKPSIGLNLLDKAGLLKKLIPELYSLHGIEEVDLVVSNLYPFQQTIEQHGEDLASKSPAEPPTAD